MNKLQLTYKEIKSRLSGFSIPLFGVSWQPKESDITIAKRVIIFLEDRRVLYSQYEVEVPSHCIDSINEIRKMLTNELSNVLQKEELYNDLQFLRASCRKFLDSINSNEIYLKDYNSFTTISGWIFLTALGELRGVFGLIIAKIAIEYGLDIQGDLVKIIPNFNDSK